MKHYLRFKVENVRKHVENFLFKVFQKMGFLCADQISFLKFYVLYMNILLDISESQKSQEKSQEFEICNNREY